MTRQDREQFVSAFAMLMMLAIFGAVIGGLGGGLLVPVAAVLVMAYAKGRFVILDFMELRARHGGLKVALLAWPAALLLLAFARAIAAALAG